MAGDYTVPTTVTKRVRFYDGQFLQDQDFIDEQKYHLARHSRHQRSLHVTGVIEGLTAYIGTSSGNTVVKVRAGSAIDPEGRLILLTETSSAIDLLSASAGDTRWVYIAYHQEPVDSPDTSQGVKQETRWLESAHIFASETLLGEGDTYSGLDWNDYLPEDEGPPSPVLLAKLTLDADGNMVVDNDVRLFSGVQLPGPETLAPTLRTDASGNVGLWLVNNNDLLEKTTFAADGKVGISTTSPSSMLHVWSATGNSGLTLQTSNNANNMGIAFRNSGEWYTWHMYRRDAGGNAADLVFANGPNYLTNLSDRIVFDKSGNVGIGKTTELSEKLEVSGNAVISNNLTVDTDTLYVDSTNHRVGIGTTEPSEALEVSGNAVISNDLIIDTNTLYVDSTNDRVGIGTDSPGDKLEVLDSSTSGDGGITVHRGRYAKLSIISDNYWSGIELRRDSAGEAGRPHIDFTNDLTSNYGIRISAPTNNALAIEGGNVGIGTTDPQASLHITGGEDASLSSHGYLMLGSTNSTNIVIDDNEMMARNNGSPSTLHLQNDGGNLNVGGRILRKGEAFSFGGYKTHGGTVTVPWGTRDDWKIFVAPRIMGHEETDSEGDNALLRVECYASSNNDSTSWTITARYKYRNSRGDGTWYSGSANYLLVPE